MLRLLVFGALCAAALLTPCKASAAPLPLGLDVALKEERLAGISWSLVDGDATMTGAAGKSNAATGTSMSPRQRVHIGSVTKTLVAVGLLRLATQGRLDLNAPVSSVLPELRFRNRWERTNPVRVRHLLDHTAGLEDLRVWQMFSGRIGPDDRLTSVFRRSPSVLRIRTRPGELFSYSNLGYTLAGMIIERVTGQRYEEWLDANLLAPLEMTDSTFGFVTQQRDPRLAWGHNDDLSLAAALPVALRPAAQFTTTAADMARFARFLMSGGAVGGKPFVRSDLLSAMGLPEETAAARAGLKPGYRFGLALRDREGRLGRCHAGNIIGYRAMFCIYPEQRKAFFYSINTDGESSNYQRFDSAMMNALQLPRLVPAANGQPAADLASWRGRYVPAVSGIALERYADLLNEGVSLEVATTTASIRADGGEPRKLAYAGGYRLRAPDRVLPSHVLLRDAEGRAVLLDGLRTYRPMGSGSYWLLWASLSFGLLSLAYVTVALPILSWRRRHFPVQPATLGPLLLMGGALLMSLQPFEQLGDATPGSVLIFLGSLALPLGAALQAVLALRCRPRFWGVDVVAAATMLQWAAVLLTFGLLPLALWS
jgi:CubicO group peptidase (beta-lactamase class C family)